MLAVNNDNSPLKDSPRILVADDQTDVLEAVRLLLKNEGFEFDLVSSPAAVLQKLECAEYDLLLMDLNYARDTTSGQEGLDLLCRVKEFDGSLPVVVMTAWGTIPLAVETMQHGVGDFVQKPWDNARLLEILRTQVAQGRLRREDLRRQRMQEQEMEEAREIQRHLIPRALPQFPGFNLAAAWRPARMVSGDCYDILPFQEGQFALCIADVAGNGMPAALLMSNLQAAVRAFASIQSTPRNLCLRLNRMISGNVPGERFITFFYARVDGWRHQLVYSNAGHNFPVLRRHNGDLLRLGGGGPVLGILEESDYREETVELKPGDRLLLFTDGVTEAMNPAGEQFGETRLLELLHAHASHPVETFTNQIMFLLEQFSQGEFHDDATLVALDVLSESH